MGKYVQKTAGTDKVFRVFPGNRITCSSFSDKLSVVFTGLLSLIIFSQLSWAQIAITRSNMETIFAPNNHMYLYADTTISVFQVDIGGTDGPHVYDFTNFQFSLIDTGNTISINQISQFSSRYPSDAISLRTFNDIGGGQGDGVEEESIIFERLPNSGLVGSWKTTDTPDDFLFLSFFEDGTYLHAEVDLDDSEEPSGMEWGTFSRNDANGQMTVAQIFDNNGNTGLTDFAGDGPPYLYLNTNSDVLIATIDEDGDGNIDETLQFQRIESSGIFGSWENSMTENDLLLLSFFEDGTYLHAEIDFDDPEEESGMEWGTFSRNDVDGLMTVAQTFDNNGGTGLTDFVGVGASFLYMNASSDDLTVYIHNFHYYYDIFRISDEGIHIVGEANISPYFERYLHFTPEELFIPFPMTFGYSTSFSFTAYDTTYIEGIPVITDVWTDEMTKNADGWGTLILPGFGTFNCLRWKEVEDNSEEDESKVFYYFTQEGYFLQINTDYTQPDTGIVSAESIVLFVPELVTGVEGFNEVSQKFSLLQNYPNPFNPNTTITYNLAINSKVSLKIYNMLGQEVKTLINDNQNAGFKSINWNGKDNSGYTVNSGIYFYQLQAGNTIQSKKMLFLK